VKFLKRFNEEVYRHFPDVQTIAEESTAWPMVSRPTTSGGLGFGLKWDMGWMHDFLRYFSKDPVHRKYHHNDLTFRMLYVFNENFVLPLSHDEVVHGKGSLVGKMPGDDWQKFANLRLLYGLMYGMLGKKMLFMGAEFGQRSEWNHDQSLEWHVAEMPLHRGIKAWVRDLNSFYRNEPALYEHDFEPTGFSWVDCNDQENGVISFIRWGNGEPILVVGNSTPVPRHGYRVGVPLPGYWKEVLNSDAAAYDGADVGNLGGQQSDSISWQGQPHSVNLTLPPLGILFFKRMSSRNE
jgi:1,4-alpha-glucan branching enzyme